MLAEDSVHSDCRKLCATCNFLAEIAYKFTVLAASLDLGAMIVLHNTLSRSPTMAVVFSHLLFWWYWLRSANVQDFGRDYNSVQLRAAHKYWSQKAANSQTPLLQRFWYDKRWARQNALKTRREEADDDDSSDDDLPFQGKNSPRKLGPRGRLLSSEDVRQRLLIARYLFACGFCLNSITLGLFNLVCIFCIHCKLRQSLKHTHLQISGAQAHGYL